ADDHHPTDTLHFQRRDARERKELQAVVRRGLLAGPLAMSEDECGDATFVPPGSPGSNGHGPTDHARDDRSPAGVWKVPTPREYGRADWVERAKPGGVRFELLKRGKLPTRLVGCPAV